MGFNVVDVVGGISYSDDIGPLGYTVNAHRRPISSSLLAFGGQKDSPSNTGKKCHFFLRKIVPSNWFTFNAQFF